MYTHYISVDFVPFKTMTLKYRRIYYDYNYALYLCRWYLVWTACVRIFLWHQYEYIYLEKKECFIVTLHILSGSSRKIFLSSNSSWRVVYLVSCVYMLCILCAFFSFNAQHNRTSATQRFPSLMARCPSVCDEIQSIQFVGNMRLHPLSVTSTYWCQWIHISDGHAPLWVNDAFVRFQRCGRIFWYMAISPRTSFNAKGRTCRMSHVLSCWIW